MGRVKSQIGITLVALVVTIIVIIILASVSIGMIVGENGIIHMAQKAKENTELAQKKEEENLKQLANELDFNLQDGYEIKKHVNAPKLAQGMEPVKFTDPTDTQKGSIIKTDTTDETWYNYDEKKWANAQTQDGSLWVWIPRFAYRVNTENQTFDIVFLIEDTDRYYDKNGNLQTAKRCTSEEGVIDTTTGYTVHPAFTNETQINFRNGGWDKEITGIWVAKFQAGYASGNNNAPIKASSVYYTQELTWVSTTENGTEWEGLYSARNWLDGIYGDKETAIKYPTFQGKTYMINAITHGEAYAIAQAMNENGNIYGFSNDSDVHLMKNSEWGACTYLSQSQYGLNGKAVAINNVNLNSGNVKRTETAGRNGVDSVYGVTGCTAGSAMAEENITTIEAINTTVANNASDGVYTWDQLTGVAASCTGTIYGVYDMSGGLWEQTTGFVANGTENLSLFGGKLTQIGSTIKTKSDKYVTIYQADTSTDNADIEFTEENYQNASVNNWKKNNKIYGEAIQETSTNGVGMTSWFNNYSNFPCVDLAFTVRAGSIWRPENSGQFYYDRCKGDSAYYYGFRVSLIV